MGTIVFTGLWMTKTVTLDCKYNFMTSLAEYTAVLNGNIKEYVQACTAIPLHHFLPCLDTDIPPT